MVNDAHLFVWVSVYSAILMNVSNSMAHTHTRVYQPNSTEVSHYFILFYLFAREWPVQMAYDALTLHNMCAVPE